MENKLKMLLCWYTVLLTIVVISAEVITLISENYVTCVLNEEYHRGASIYIYPNCDDEIKQPTDITLEDYARMGSWYERDEFLIYTTRSDGANYYRCQINSCFDKTFDRKCEHQCGTSGYIGEMCNVNCATVLGFSYASCNNHRICYEGDSCLCALGYKGDFCELPAASNEYLIFAIALFLFCFCVSSLVLVFLNRYLKNIRNKLDLAVPSIQVENMTNDILVTNKELVTKINVEDFEKYVKDIFLNHSYSNQQFDKIPNEKFHSCSIALQDKNSNKNRDQDSIPYDYNRVILKDLPGVGTDDYINGSFLDGFSRPKSYIICQGPKFNTVLDFWRMIWQEEVQVIVMATNFIDGNERMCADYWNQKVNAISEWGELIVRVTKEEVHEYYDSRILEVRYRSHRRELRHFYLKWNSDYKKSLYPNDIIPVLKRIREISENNTKPIVIHSGFGINRSGTLILCDLALQMAKSEGSVDFYQLLKKMRNQRPNMLSRKEYYTLSHLIVLEYLSEQNNPFKELENLDNNSDPEIEKMVNSYLEKLFWQDSRVSAWMPQYKIDTALDSVFVDGCGQSKKIVIIKKLTEKMILDFWYLVGNQQINCILLLDKLKFNLWPIKSQNAAIVINVTNSDEKSTYFEPNFSETANRLSLLIYNSVTNEVHCDRQIWFFQLQNCDWKGREPGSRLSHNVVETIINMKKIPLQEKQILIGSGYKNEATDLVPVLFYALEKYEQDLEADVCDAFRVVRRSGLNFSTNMKQIRFIQMAIRDLLNSFDKYYQQMEISA